MYYSLNISGGRLWLESGADVKDVEGKNTKFVLSDEGLVALKWDIERILERVNTLSKRVAV